MSNSLKTKSIVSFQSLLLFERADIVKSSLAATITVLSSIGFHFWPNFILSLELLCLLFCRQSNIYMELICLAYLTKTKIYEKPIQKQCDVVSLKKDTKI